VMKALKSRYDGYHVFVAGVRAHDEYKFRRSTPEGAPVSYARHRGTRVCNGQIILRVPKCHAS
jgi:hypothetical protein